MVELCPGHSPQRVLILVLLFSLGCNAVPSRKDNQFTITFLRTWKLYATKKIHLYLNLVPRVLSFLSLGRLRRTSRREPWERVCFYPYSQAVPLGVLMVYYGQATLYSLDNSFFLLPLFLLRHLQVRETVWVGLSHPKCEVIRNKGNFLMESGIQLNESGILLTIGIPGNRSPRSIHKKSGIQYLWSGIPQCGIQNPRHFWTALHGANWDRLIRFLCQKFKCFASQV